MQDRGFRLLVIKYGDEVWKGPSADCNKYIYICKRTRMLYFLSTTKKVNMQKCLLYTVKPLYNGRLVIRKSSLRRKITTLPYNPVDIFWSPFNGNYFLTDESFERHILSDSVVKRFYCTKIIMFKPS